MSWFRQAKAKAPDDEAPAAPAPAPANDAGPRPHHPQADLMAEISGFLLDNGLAITPANLAAAHAAFSGASFRLSREIATRQIAGEPISQAWFDGVLEAEGIHPGAAPGAALLKRLHAGVEEFGGMARSARGATREYATAVEAHVVELERHTTSGDGADALADLARQMAERTRAMEHALRRSEEEAVRLRESLANAQRSADLDHLTGLPNRRAFERVLDTQFREAQQAIDNLVVAFVDIDHFKRVNDTHGHDVGDRVIREVAQVLGGIANAACHVARHGGEEFVLLFRGKSPREAQAVLDGTRDALAKRRLRNRDTDTPIGVITFSGGVAGVFDFPGPREALRAADQALYRAKQEGRNRIELA